MEQKRTKNQKGKTIPSGEKSKCLAKETSDTPFQVELESGNDPRREDAESSGNRPEVSAATQGRRRFIAKNTPAHFCLRFCLGLQSTHSHSLGFASYACDEEQP